MYNLKVIKKDKIRLVNKVKLYKLYPNLKRKINQQRRREKC